MSKLSKIVGLAMVVSFTVSFCLADSTTSSTPSTGSGQATPMVKAKGKTPSTGSGQAKSKLASKKINKAKGDKTAADKDAYICPMCRITADKPGKCPMCGMDMVKNEKKDDKKTADEKKL